MKNVCERSANAEDFSSPAAPSRGSDDLQLQDSPAPIRHLIEDIVADVFGVRAAELRLATRGKARVALARQVAMYIAHVGYGLTLTEVGNLFERDRTTVAHACSIVEQRRDDQDFDAAVAILELIVRALEGARAASHPAGRDESGRATIPPQ